MNHPTPVRSHTLGPTGQPRTPLSPAPPRDLGNLPTEQFTAVVPSTTAILPPAHPVDVRSPRGPGRRRPTPEVVERRSTALWWIGVGAMAASVVIAAASVAWAVWRG